MIKKIFAAGALLASSIVGVQSASADGPDPYIAEVVATAGNFCPRGYERASGQLMPISQNTALFSLIGTIYGGDGRTTFALPNLNGRAAMGEGSGPGLTPRRQGEQLGQDTTTVTVSQMPVHSHTMNASAGSQNAKTYGGNNFATFPSGAPAYAGGTTPNETLSQETISSTGGGQSMNNMQPSLVLTWCIATQGVYPSRS